MYGLTKELFHFLLNNSKGKIGLLDPQGAIGTDQEYTLEQDYPIDIPCKDNDGNLHIDSHKPEIEGFWLWKRGELENGNLEMTAKEGNKTKKEVLEGVLVRIKDEYKDKKLTCKPISTYQELIYLEPNLKNFLEIKN